MGTAIVVAILFDKWIEKTSAGNLPSTLLLTHFPTDRDIPEWLHSDAKGFLCLIKQSLGNGGMTGPDDFSLNANQPSIKVYLSNLLSLLMLKTKLHSCRYFYNCYSI